MTTDKGHVPNADYVRESAERALSTWRNMPRYLRERAVSMGLIDAKWLDYEATQIDSSGARDA